MIINLLGPFKTTASWINNRNKIILRFVFSLEKEIEALAYPPADTVRIIFSPILLDSVSLLTPFLDCRNILCPAYLPQYLLPFAWFWWLTATRWWLIYRYFKVFEILVAIRCNELHAHNNHPSPSSLCLIYDRWMPDKGVCKGYGKYKIA